MRARRLTLALAVLSSTACTDAFGPGDLADPRDLSYALVPNGDPEVPDGVLLRWTDADDDRVAAYVIYSRASTRDGWSRRGETTSNTFHDAGMPHLQYYVASVDDRGRESRGSNTVTIDERNRLPAPTGLGSISLDGAVHLGWSDNARRAGGTAFDHYRVYSTQYDLDAGTCVAANWVLEGTTVSEDFLATGLANGGPVCLAVSSVSRDGHESVWSQPRTDTPRWESRFVIVDAVQSVAATSGFRFYDAASRSLGLVTAGTRTDLDFKVDRRTDGSLWLTPVRSDVRIALYDLDPVADLTDIDIAPADAEFLPGAIEAVPGYAYVFRVLYADGAHYAALRVQHVSASYVIFDWAYQSDPGNPELRRTRSAAGI